MNYLGTPADFTILVLLVVIGVAVWFVWERITQLQRDVDALKQKLGAGEQPSNSEH